MPDNHYKTSDTTLASYLICNGFIPTRIDYSQPRYEYSFVGNSAQLEKLTATFITGQGKVDPVIFARINRKLLRILNRQIQWGED